MEVGQAQPLTGQCVEVGGINLAAIAAEIAVAQIIGHDDQKVRPFGGLAGGTYQAASQRGQRQVLEFHCNYLFYC